MQFPVKIVNNMDADDVFCRFPVMSDKTVEKAVQGNGDELFGVECLFGLKLNGVISDRDHVEIQSASTEREKCGKILDILSGKRQEELLIFCQLLTRSSVLRDQRFGKKLWKDACDLAEGCCSSIAISQGVKSSEKSRSEVAMRVFLTFYEDRFKIPVEEMLLQLKFDGVISSSKCALFQRLNSYELRDEFFQLFANNMSIYDYKKICELMTSDSVNTVRRLGNEMLQALDRALS